MWDFLSGIANATSSVATFVVDFFSNIFSAISNVLTWFWENLLSPAFTSIGNAISSVVTALTSSLQWLWDNFLSPAFTAIGDAFSWLGNAIGGFFSGLWDSISDFFAGIPEFFANFWNSLKNFFISIFVPEEGYFDNTINDLKSKFSERIDITEYQRAFTNLQEISEGDTAGLDVNFKDYKIGDTGKMLATPKKWVDFDFVLSHKETWFSWCRAVTWIFFIIYNINQFLKVLWGRTASDGSSLIRASSNKEG